MRLRLVHAFHSARILLLMDAFGAATSAIATYCLLTKELLKTGLPTGLLNSLAIAAVIFMCYDFIAFSRRTQHSTSLFIIACLNFAYSAAVLALLYLYRNAMTPVGLFYFCMEIAIVLSLSIWELVTALRSAE